MINLVRLYPSAWRERYGEEFARLIEDRPPSFADRLDIVRGAVDAQLHPHVLVDGGEPAPWTHRLPGLLALSAGLALTAGVLGISFGPGPDWGAAETIAGSAVMLMLISLPGDYLASFGRRIGLALVFVIGGVFAAPATDWWPPAVALAIFAELLAVCGLLTMAAIRAGIGTTGRWLLLGATVLPPAIAAGAAAAFSLVTGQSLVPAGSPITSLVLLPYGLVWLLVGLRMAVRGSPTIIDSPTDSNPTIEVQRA